MEIVNKSKLELFFYEKQMSPPFLCQKHESFNTISNRNIKYNFLQKF